MKKKIDWAAYNESLKQRGSLTFWISDEAIESWEAQSQMESAWLSQGILTLPSKHR